MDEKKIKCYVVTGFYEAGKTTYIQENIFRDFFHKRGDTLILAFEDGEAEYDTARLAEYRTTVEMYEGGESIPAFCNAMIEKHQPGRIFIEANVMTEDLMEQLPEQMQICDTTVLIDGDSFPIYFQNMRQLVQNMVTAANMVIFHRCESKEQLAEYATPMRLMNDRCVYLWESPMGYGEQAFGLYLPYSLEDEHIVITDETFPIWFLDASKSPDHYYGKTMEFNIQVKTQNHLPDDRFIAGRLLMTCCLADMQFCGVECINGTDMEVTDGDWIHLIAKGREHDGPYGNKLLLHTILLEEGEAKETILS